VSESKLKPCPFCGNRLTVKLGHDLADNTLFGWECKGCGIASPPYPTKSDAINAANSRPDKEKVCVWTWQANSEYWATACGEQPLYNNNSESEKEYKFCPYCSARIETEGGVG
jgi:Lar family restriction alleviation protein